MDTLRKVMSWINAVLAVICLILFIASLFDYSMPRSGTAISLGGLIWFGLNTLSQIPES